MGITDIWTVIILRPMLNALLWLYQVLGGQFWLAIIIFTVIVRTLMTPFMLPQQRSAKRMQELQPRLQELQKKYANDREKLAQEQMRLYKEVGFNPLGGCLPMLLQFPIWIGLYQSIIQALGHQPLQLLNLSQNIYAFMSGIWTAIPLNRYFLGMDLSLTPQQVGGLAFALPVLVAFTSWLQARMTTSTTPGGGEGQAASMNQSMTLMMPLMFGFFSLNFSNGLSFYFVVSNIIGIITQGFISGWEGLLFWRNLSLSSILGGGRANKTPSRSTAAQAEVSADGSGKGSTSERKKRKKKRRRKR
ncbi:MAG TPA: YidC/Oxa1 family membrane protein insertase [Anaerolineae bacterium]|nr:YidC/Oxa1 family membrane protein insertase [Anaerolineae bacterium]